MHIGKSTGFGLFQRVGRLVGMDKQAASELAPDRDIQKLLAHSTVEPLRYLLMVRGNVVAVVGRYRRFRHCISQIGQAVLLCLGNELRK